MRKVIRVMVSSILVAMLYLNSVWANELNDRTLDFRNFTVNDVSQFIEQEGIQIPEDIQRVSDYEDIIYSIMMSAYEDPQYRPEYQYTKMQELAEIIAKKVRVYTFAEASTYGKLDKANSVAAVAPTYQLQDSVRYGGWNNSYLDYNCYGFALDRMLYGNPGFYCHIPIDISKPTSAIADLTLADLRSLGYTATYTTTRPVSLPSYKHMVALRKSATDYHFMKYSSGSWLHKPGNTNPLKYKYTPTNSRAWMNEYIYINTPKPPTQYYTDTIYYIIYWILGGGGTTSISISN
ncbi:MAG: hypothetical protein KA953_06525 [Lachnospiraceae bacterium]|nr:hypothetical protein [Lachnospiraceae bacterium]